MLNRQHEAQSFSMGEFVWWIGVVEDRMDPKKLGRVRVRMMGYHTDDKTLMPTEELHWAFPMQDIRSAAISGIGFTPTGMTEGTWCMGFFRDGHNAQDAVVMGTLGGMPSETADPSKGFNDPKGKYPLEDFLDEADTMRFGRNEKIDETVVQTKKNNRDLSVSRSMADGPWDEPEPAYAGQYPYCHVRYTESGHIEEYDDTEGAERYHRYLKPGGFLEVNSEGTELRKIQKDKYEIILGDEYVHVKGDVTITVDGNVNLLVQGNVREEVSGNKDEYIHGKYQLKVGGETVVESGGQMYLDAPRIDLNKPGPGISF